MFRSAPGLALLLAILAPTVAGAQAAPAADTVLVGVLGDWPPVYTTSAEGRPGGFGIEVMEEVARRAGLALRYRSFGSFPVAMEALSADRIDVIPNVGVLEARRDELGLSFTAPYETQSVRVFVRGVSSDLQAVDDLADRRLAVVNYNVGVDLAAQVSSVEPVVVSDVRTAIFRLLSGEVDGLIYPEPVVRHLARAADVDDEIRGLEPALREVRRGIAVSPGRTDDLLPRLDEALASFRDTPAFQETYIRWHMPPEPFFTRDRLLALFGAVLLLVLGGMAVWRHVSLLRLNRRLREQEARFRSLAEGLAEGIVIINLEEGRIAYVNQRCCQMLGYERSELEGMRPERVMATPAARKALPERLVDRARGMEESYEVQLVRSDGSLLWVHVHASPYMLDGEVAGSLAALTDITARKEAENELAERRRRQAQRQRLEAVGRLAGGVAHDFNNLLTGITGIATLLLDEADSDHPWREDLESILVSAERGADLTRQLLVFSRQDPPRVQKLNPTRVLREAEALLRRTLGEDVVLKTDFPEDVGPLEMDRSQLDQIVMNLAVNARQAMPRGGELVLALDQVGNSGDSDEAEDAAGAWIRLTVRDTGVGMDPETRERIFEPFFTTKADEGGSGMGLSTVYGIVEQAGGEIRVESEEGQGTEFQIFLPAHGDGTGDG